MKHPRLLFILIVLCAGALYLVGNARVALWDRDEPRYAMASRWMLRSGDWVVPRIGWGENPDEPRTAKPPVIYWCQAAAMKLLGPGEFAARLPSAIGMFLTLLLVGGVLLQNPKPETRNPKQIQEDRDDGQGGKGQGSEQLGESRNSKLETRNYGQIQNFPVHALLTTLILSTSVLCIAAAKMCLIDALLLFFVTICQLGVFAMWRGKTSWPVVVIFAIALGIAGLAKGPIVLGVVLATIVMLAVFWAWDHWFGKSELPQALPELPDEAPHVHAGLGKLTDVHAGPRSATSALTPLLKIIVAIAIVVAIVLPWLILVEKRSPGFLQQIIGHDVVQRMRQPLEGHKGPPGFYLVTIFAMFFPWSIFIPMAIGNAWRQRRRPAIRFALAAVIGPWIMLECISTKMVHYLLPAYPPLAFLVADALIQCFENRSNDLTRPLARWGFSIWAIITTAIATALLLPAKWFMQTPLWPGVLMMLAGLIYAIIVLAFIWHRKQRRAVIAMGAGFWAMAILLFTTYLPTASFLRISPNVAAILNKHHVTDARMIGYDEQSIAFYDHGLIDDLPGKVFHEPVTNWPKWLVMSGNIFDRLPKAKRQQLTIVGKVRGIQYAKSPKPIEVLVVKVPHEEPRTK